MLKFLSNLAINLVVFFAVLYPAAYFLGIPDLKNATLGQAFVLMIVSYVSLIVGNLASVMETADILWRFINTGSTARTGWKEYVPEVSMVATVVGIGIGGVAMGLALNSLFVI